MSRERGLLGKKVTNLYSLAMDRNLVQKLAQKHSIGEKITTTIEYSCLDRRGEPTAMVTLRRLQDDGLVDIKAAEEIKNEFELASPNVKRRLEEQYLGIPKLLLEDPAIYG